MGILTWIFVGYFSLCYVVVGLRKRFDSRYHYASNMHPERQVYRRVLERVGGKMEEREVSWLDDDYGVVRTWSHPRPSWNTIPDSVRAWFAPLYWRFRAREHLVAICFSVYLVAGAIWYLWPESFAYWLAELGPWLKFVAFASLPVAIVCEIVSNLLMPSRLPAVQAANRLWRFLTLRPSPAPAPSEVIQRNREASLLQAQWCHKPIQFEPVSPPGSGR